MAAKEGWGKGKGPGAQRAGPYSKGEADVPALGLLPGTPRGEGPPDEGRMVYVGGVPLTAEWQELKDHMKQAGEIEFAQILPNDWGQSRGVGFVRYTTEQGAQTAIATLNGSVMPGMKAGKVLEVDMWTGKKPSTFKGGQKGCKGAGKWAPYDVYSVVQMFSGKTGGTTGAWGKGEGKTGEQSYDKKNKVWVGNLPTGAEWQELKDHMKQAGTVEYVKTNGATGEVRYSTPEEAQNAIALLNGSELMGGAIIVDVWN